MRFRNTDWYTKHYAKMAESAVSPPEDEVDDSEPDQLDAEDPELTMQLRAVKGGRSLRLVMIATAFIAIGSGIALVL